MEALQAPFIYFGGKARAASLIWERLGDVTNFVDPFCGSCAVLLARPHSPGLETVNDKDAFLANVLRALRADPEAVAVWCDRQPNEADLHAIHTWLVAQRADFTARLMGDPDYYDVRVAGRWLWGINLWIGSGWCSGNGPWQSVEGRLVHTDATTDGQGVHRKRLHVMNAGMGVHRQRLHVMNAGMGVHRQRLHVMNAGRGVHRQRLHAQEGLYAWFDVLQTRLRHVRVCCGDWTRVLGPSVTIVHGLTGIVLDPPYSLEEDRDMSLYALDDGEVAHAVRQWCLEQGDNPLLRIILCGYAPVHDALLAHGWQAVPWAAHGGMGNYGNGRGRTNKTREVLYCSPHCLQPAQGQGELFAAQA